MAYRAFQPKGAAGSLAKGLPNGHLCFVVMEILAASTVEDIGDANPAHWSQRRIRDYHRELQVIHGALQDASPFLAERLRPRLGEYAAFAMPDSLQR